MVPSALHDALRRRPGPARTAALAAWFQGLFEDPRTAPVLVGGGAVELYTSGSYLTGDLDFVGVVSDPVAQQMTLVGFRRMGRHWVHEESQVFIELPARSFDAETRIDEVRFDAFRVRVISLENALVDRLLAWCSWNSAVDGVNAYLLWRVRGRDLDRAWLDRLAAREDARDALDALEAYIERLGDRIPSLEEVEEWARTRV
ncbi:MAG: hypothetical protein ABR559_07970 [Gemmatimonadota bacterium]